MAKLILFIWLQVAFSAAMGATIIPISLDRQLQDATGVIHGILLEQKSVHKFDKVFTESTFKVIRSSGLQYRDIKTANNFSVIYPGGTWQGIKYDVSGSPRFSIGEEVILLISKTSIGFVPTNSGLAKYNFLKEGREEYLVSSYFPAHTKLGKIPVALFEESISNIVGERLADHGLDRTRSSKAKVLMSKKQAQRARGGRGLASARGDNGTKKRSESSVFWPVLLFALLGAYTVIIAWKRKN